MPASTSIPTPTLHPAFIEIQEKIEAPSGTRFTLNSADRLVYDKETPIPGLTVAPDGTMTLTVNGETVTLDPAQVNFDDVKGIVIEGYKLDEETGAWVEVVPTPEELMQAELDTIAPNIDMSQFVVEKSENGKAILLDKKGNVIFDGRSWSDKALITILSTTPNSCDPTDMPMRTQFLTTAGTLQNKLAEYQIDIRQILRDTGRDPGETMTQTTYYIPKSDNCWALLIGGERRGSKVIKYVLDGDIRFVAWRNNKGEAVIKPVFNGGLIKQ